MRRKDTLSVGFAKLAGRISGLTGLLLLCIGGTALGQATFVGNNFNIPLAAGATSGVASGTVQVSCVGVVANGATISVTVNNTHTFEGDLSYWLIGPTGAVLELSTRNGGGNNNLNAVFSDAGALTIPGTAVTTSTTTLPCGTAGQSYAYNGTFKPEGRNNVIPAFPTSPSDVPALSTFTFANTYSGLNADGTWTLVINDHVGGDLGATCNWSISFAGVNIPSCSFVGAPVIPAAMIGMDLGTCASQPINVPGVTGSCTTTTISYSINGGAFVTVPNGATTIDPNLAAGTYTITWRVVNQCLQVTTATQQITVQDNEKPTFTSCPGDIIVNLNPGDCSALVNYDVQATDNCNFLISNSGQPGYTFPLVGAGGISVAGANLPGGYMFDLQNTTSFPMLINSVEVRFGPTGFTGPATGTATTVSAYYTTVANTWVGNNTNAGAWTLVGGAPINVTVGPQNGNTLVTLPTPITLAAGQTRGIFLFGDTYSLIYNNAGLSTATPQNINGELLLTSGVAQGTAFQTGLQFGPPRSPQVRFNYQYGPGLFFTLTNQTPNWPSGSSFPIGSTFVSWKATDASGNMATCSFNVIVNEYPNPVGSLTCNDLVYVSLDEDCSYCLGADGVLEGGPYHCYDDYIVEVDKTAPFGNGPWLPACFGPADIGKTYQVRVTDPDNGNKCWGNVKIEDKLAPVLDCPTVSLPCNADVSPEAQQSLITKGSATFAIPASGAVVVNIPVAGVNAPVEDLNITFVTDHTWVGDISATLVSPSGTSVTFFDRPGVPAAGLGCDGDGMDVLFDDEAASTYAQFEATCGNLPAIAGAFQPNSALSAFDGEDPNGTWVLTVNDLVGGDGGPNSSITLSIAQTGGAGFPNGLVYNNTVFSTGNPNQFVVPAGAGVPQLDNCSDVTLTYSDTQVPKDCASGLTATINRKWTAKDGSGNTSTCIQQINLTRPTLADVTLPTDYDGIDAPFFLCTDNSYPTPDWIEGQGLQGWPYVFGVPSGCSINWAYEDVVIEVCDGTYKIRRQWTIIDWCIGDGFEYNQIIKVVDNQGPSFDCPANITITTDPFVCCGSTNLPDVIITDNCSRIDNISGMIITFDPQTNQQTGMYQIGGELTDFPANNWWNPDTLGAFGWTPCLPLGTHTVIYQAEDNCGNTSTCSFRITVRDYTPPQVACQEFTTVAINVDDPFDCYGPAGPNGLPAALDACSGAGVTWVKASSFDSGSFDNCGNIKLTIQRMGPDYNECIQGLNSVNGHPNCADQFPDFPSEFERAVSEGDSIKFYCCEVGTTQTVILTAYQLDAQGNITVGPDGSPVANQCMIQVEVQDKIKPVCTPPANVSVSCENFDPSLWAYGKATPYDNCCLDTTKVYQGQCGLSHSASYTLFDTVCNRGTITRTFRAYDCHGFSSQCTQRVFVKYEQDYFIKFPNDVIVTVCDGTGNYGEPLFNGEDCELLGVSFEDEVFTVVPDACYKIERTWTIINWCTYNPNLPCTYVPNPNPNPITNNTQNLPGPIVSAPGTLAPWAPTVVKVNPSDAAQTNYSVFYTGGTYNGTTILPIDQANCYVYKQVIKVIDTQAPTVVGGCPASPVEFCDLTVNNPQLWNEMYWWDGVIGQHDLCEGPADLNITATDACSLANINIEYLLFLDLDGDGTMETVISSTNLPGVNNVYYNNASNPNFGGGIPRAFDERPVPLNQKYRFGIDRVKDGNNLKAYVRWDTQSSQINPNDTNLQGVVPELPYGTHKIKWILSDGCGNQYVCEYTFIVKDCKPPTVVCLNGLSVNIMPTGMITLWATDFLQYAEDNCTPPTPYTQGNQLKFAIRKSGTGTGFPVDGFGQPITNVTFTCDEIGTQPVELWAQDAAGNAAYCETYVIVQDPFNNCGGNPISVAGALKTETAQGVEDAQVELAGNPPNGLPAINALGISDNAGTFLFSNALPLSTDYTVTPTKDDNPMNGVSTFDLVLMSKHILGIEPLNSPYKIIAADVNKSNSVTTFDIVELRKLILGIYTELPNNTSWRFIDKTFTFAQPTNPFASVPFAENISLGDAQASQNDDDFTGIKIGDLNGSVIANATQQADDRSAGTLLMDVEDRDVKAGETFDVTFKTAEQVQGFQFTLNLNGLQVADIVKSDKVSADNFGVFTNALTTSIDGAAEFTVKFRAEKAGKLSRMLQLSSQITRCEAYNAGGQNLDVALRFSGNTIAGVGFELYQNQPNPWVGRTQIGFHLPVAATATLTVYDETGRVLFTQKGDYAKGYNAVSLDRAVLNTSGVLYYKLETATDAATMKMIQTK